MDDGRHQKLQVAREKNREQSENLDGLTLSRNGRTPLSACKKVAIKVPPRRPKKPQLGSRFSTWKAPARCAGRHAATPTGRVVCRGRLVVLNPGKR
jgi:hypothetical protein